LTRIFVELADPLVDEFDPLEFLRALAGRQRGHRVGGGWG
jgi:hypothetical protein